MSGLLRRDVMVGMVAALAAPRAFAQPRPTRFPDPDRELMVKVDGGRVYVRVNGDLAGPRPPLVMIHGGPGGHHLNMMYALPLADERAVILYDQLDSGKSERPNDKSNWTVDRFVNELGHVRKALGVERWHTYGSSWGGTIALEYAARRPAPLMGTALASPLVNTAMWLKDASALLASLPPETQYELARCDMPEPPAQEVCDEAMGAFDVRFNAREKATDAARAYRATFKKGFNFELYETMWGRTEFTATGSLKTYDGTPLLAKLKGERTLFLAGQHDEVRVPTLAAYAAAVPGAEFAIVPGAAHSLLSDRPGEVTAILRNWLARQDALAGVKA